MIEDIFTTVVAPAIWVYNGAPVGVIASAVGITAFRFLAPEKFEITKDKIVEWFWVAIDYLSSLRKKG